MTRGQPTIRSDEGPNGYDTGGLRSDHRQWLIYGGEAQGAVIRGLEAWALKVLGARLKNTGPDRIRSLNGIGNYCDRVADQRLVEMKRNGGAQEVVADWVLMVSKFAAGKTPWSTDIQRACDDMHATVWQTDSRGNAAGMNGGGVHRQAIRGD